MSLKIWDLKYCEGKILCREIIDIHLSENVWDSLTGRDKLLLRHKKIMLWKSQMHHLL